MNRDECRTFFREIIFVHFPGFQSWLASASGDNAFATIDAWQQTLRDITTEEAISVVYRWTRDELPRPKGLEMQDFALHLRGVVMMDRYKQRQKIATSDILDQEKPISIAGHKQMGPYYRRIMANSDQYRLGLMTLEQCKLLNAEIVKEFCERKSS